MAIHYNPNDGSRFIIALRYRVCRGCCFWYSAVPPLSDSVVPTTCTQRTCTGVTRLQTFLGFDTLLAQRTPCWGPQQDWSGQRLPLASTRG